MRNVYSIVVQIFGLIFCTLSVVLLTFAAICIFACNFNLKYNISTSSVFLFIIITLFLLIRYGISKLKGNKKIFVIAALILLGILAFCFKVDSNILLKIIILFICLVFAIPFLQCGVGLIKLKEDKRRFTQALSCAFMLYPISKLINGNHKDLLFNALLLVGVIAFCFFLELPKVKEQFKTLSF